MESYILIENEQAIAKIYLKGAELCSLKDKASQTEFMWQADPEHWGKHSPILFPIVGSLKNGEFFYQNNSYQMARHGFARDMNFELEARHDSNATFVLFSNEATLKQYPFKFKLSITYTLQGNQLDVQYKVENTDSKTLHFSIGGHPAFKVPIQYGLTFEDYQLHFKLKTLQELVKIYPLDENGLLQQEGIDFLPQADAILPLQKDLFKQDALIFKDITSMQVRIFSPKDKASICLSCDNFPYLGIWSKYGADFVCIEPWQGITDTTETTSQLEEKLGMMTLTPNAHWQGHCSLSFEV